MTHLLTPGQTAYRQYGPLHVRIDRHHEGVTITTQVGAERNPILSRTFTNAQIVEGRKFQAYLRDNAHLPVWQIEAGVSALLATAAVFDQAEQDLIDGINATMGEKRAELNASTEQARQIRDQVQAQQANTGGWYAARKTARNTIPFRPTATRVHTQPPTPAQYDRIRQHHNGRVTCAPGQAWTLLRGIVDRGYADRASIEYKPGTRQYRAIHLNKQGWALLGQNIQEQAA